jgi:Fic family protein
MSTLQREYPHLLFKKHWTLSEISFIYLGQCEAYIRSINNTPILPHHYQQLMNVTLLTGAQATTAIEGNTLSDEEVKKVMEHQKLPPSKAYQEIEVKNILEAFNELLNETINDKIEQIITVDLLKRFHKMVGKDLGERFIAIPGQLRNNDVVVGSYRCPDYRDVSILLEKMCEWLKDEFKYKEKEQSFSEVVIQAIVSHIYIKWIHPFGDGNGRTGRLVEFYILLRGGNPDIASHILSNYYNLTRTEYYRQIEKATQEKDLSSFIEYALLGFRDGLVQTSEIIQRSQFETTWKSLIYGKFDEIRSSVTEDVFKRQRTLALELPMGKQVSVSDIPNISIPLARIYSNISEKTIRRDIEKLFELGLVVKQEDKYIANTSVLYSMIAKWRIANYSL